MKTLKKYVAMLALASLVLGPVQALAATNATTTLTVASGSAGTAPVVEATWIEETTPTAAHLESGDTTHLTYWVDASSTVSNSQILPPLVSGADKTLTVCSVVRDSPLSSISGVWADIYYPTLMDETHCANMLGNKQWPLTRVYDEMTQVTAAKNRFNAAVAAHLVRFATGKDSSIILQEIDDQATRIYCGTFLLNYEDPAGLYSFNVRAMDTTSLWGHQWDTFDYTGVAGIEIDFANYGLNYGIVNVNSWVQVDGDQPSVVPNAWTTAANPTVRNIGNVPVTMTVWQDRMGTAHDVDINYKARMGGSTATTVAYAPYTTVGLPDVLALSAYSKLDFYVNINKPIEGQTAYTGQLVLGSVGVPLGTCGSNPIPSNERFLASNI
jgi:hypothetical protein